MRYLRWPLALILGAVLAMAVPVGAQMVKLGSSSGGSGAPTTAQYWTGAADATLSAEIVVNDSAGLASALSDETGTGAAVFANSPSFTTPDLGTPSAVGLTNATGLPEAQVTQHEAAIDHDALTNFVADEHVAHSGVTITAGEGLTGGGDISANRTLDFDINGLTAQGSPTGSADYVAIYDAGLAAHRKVLLDDLPSGSSDIISEGDSNVEVIDAGSGQIDFDIDGVLQWRIRNDGSLTTEDTSGALIAQGIGASSSTALFTFKNDEDTGMGRVAGDDGVLIGGGQQALRFGDLGSGTGVIAQANTGTAPSASLTNGYLQYGADITAGNAAPHFRTEAGDIVKLYTVGDYTVTGSSGRTIDCTALTGDANTVCLSLIAVIEDLITIGLFE